MNAYKCCNRSSEPSVYLLYPPLPLILLLQRYQEAVDRHSASATDAPERRGQVGLGSASKERFFRPYLLSVIMDNINAHIHTTQTQTQTQTLSRRKPCQHPALSNTSKLVLGARPAFLFYPTLCVSLFFDQLNPIHPFHNPSLPLHSRRSTHCLSPTQGYTRPIMRAFSFSSFTSKTRYFTKNTLVSNDPSAMPSSSFFFFAHRRNRDFY